MADILIQCQMINISINIKIHVLTAAFQNISPNTTRKSVIIHCDKIIVNKTSLFLPHKRNPCFKLKIAIAGFFYKNVSDAQDTKGRLLKQFEVASKTEGSDPFKNVLPRSTSGPTRKSSGSEFAGDLKSIEETPDRDDTDEIHGNTPCRIIYNAAKRYPNLKLPSTVFTKLYYYSSRLWEENDLMCLMVPEKKGYYDVFFNELVINEKLAESPSSVRHNDVREANIHVSVSGKISLIDFGLSDCTNNEEHKKNDFESLDQIIEILNSSENDDQVNQNSQQNEGMLSDEAVTDSKYGSDTNSSEEAVFDELSIESLNTRTTKEDVNSKGSHR